MKWLIALGKIAENQRKNVEAKAQAKKEDGEIYVLKGDKILYYSN